MVCLAGMALFLFSCSPTRRLTDDQYLLVKNRVVEKTRLPKSQQDDIASYVQQKPNRKLFGVFRTYLQIYNIPDPVRLDSLREAKEHPVDIRPQEKNNYFKRLADTVKTQLNHTYLVVGDWLQRIGEPPVLVDSFKVEKSVDLLTRYAHNKGFFHATVKDSIAYRNQKATVYYFVDRGPAYYVDTILYDVSSPVLMSLIEKNAGKSKLKKGMKYDVDLFDEERDRLTQIFQDEGFFLFRKDFIKFTADTSVIGNQHMELTLVIDDPFIQYLQGKDTLTITHHKQFRINEVYVIPKYQLKEAQYYPDTMMYKDYTFLYNGKLNYNPKVLSQSVYLRKGGLYRKRNDERTNRAFSELRNFKYIHIRYTPILSDSTYDKLNCYVELSPTPKQNLGVDLQGTNTEGNLGVSVSSTYQNKNIFKGAEVLEFKVTVGAEIQVLQGDSASLNYNTFGPFNTFEAGAQLSLITPRFLFPINISKIKKRTRPLTRISLSANFQSRPDYSRIVGGLTFGYEWQSTTKNRNIALKHVLNPGEASLIKIWKSDSFASYINQIDDQFVKNSFTDHYIQGMSYTFLMNNQDINNPDKSFFFMRINGQIGGNFLNLLSYIGKDQPINGYHTVFDGIRYSQYARIDIDFRYYANLHRNHTIASRLYIGVGVPYGNSTVLPFEKSFFAGGANDLRAWLPRTLGPGSYRDTSGGRVDQVGDMKILINAEYRVKMYKFLEGAIFADFGNIWLVRKDGDRPQGNFDFARFWNEFALGAGVGLRLNFNFFIFRLDVAMPFRDPTKPDGERWVIAKLKFEDVRWNIGIGYPF